MCCMHHKSQTSVCWVNAAQLETKMRSKFLLCFYGQHWRDTEGLRGYPNPDALGIFWFTYSEGWQMCHEQLRLQEWWELERDLIVGEFSILGSFSTDLWQNFLRVSIDIWFRTWLPKSFPWRKADGSSTCCCRNKHQSLRYSWWLLTYACLARLLQLTPYCQIPDSQPSSSPSILWDLADQSEIEVYNIEPASERWLCLGHQRLRVFF